MLSVKKGVKIAGMSPEILLGIMIVNGVYEEFGYQCTITEIMPTVKHVRASKHITGDGVDIRKSNIPFSKRKGVYLTCKAKLGENYDFVNHKSHNHLEFNPK